VRHDATLPFAEPRRSPTDGWLGTRELPGYRAGRVVARLNDLPAIDPDNLYFDLLLLDADGRTQDYHAGVCPALGRKQSLAQRSRFVRMVAELVRHAPSDDEGLAAIHPTLTFIRERGVGIDRLITAAQLLDNACSESAVIASLADMLELSLGEEEAGREMSDIVARLARTAGLGAIEPPASRANPTSTDVASRVREINERGLETQLKFVIRTVGKAHARHYLREATHFAMVPRPDMLGL